MYAWNGNILHGHAGEQLEKDNINISAGGTYERSKQDTIFIDQTEPMQMLNFFMGWKRFKNKKKFLNKVQQMFPKVKTVSLFRIGTYPIDKVPV